LKRSSSKRTFKFNKNQFIYDKKNVADTVSSKHVKNILTRGDGAKPPRHGA
jgi:hypothetical protein